MGGETRVNQKGGGKILFTLFTQKHQVYLITVDETDKSTTILILCATMTEKKP